MAGTTIDHLRAELEGDTALAAQFFCLDEMQDRYLWARNRGYIVTEDEISQLTTDELSDDELDMVAGGWDNGNGGG